MKNLQAIFLTIIVLSCFFLFSSCEKERKEADLIITNANIWTGNTQQPNAQAMAIRADTIIAIGSNEEINIYKGAKTKLIDSNGKFIVPGFIDSHVHLLTGGRSLLSVELRDASTQAEFTKRIADFAKSLKPNEWILEGNWDHTLWGGELPHKDWVDAYTKDNPVALYRLDGHMVFANSAALKFAGIDKNTPEVAGGKIIRDANGEPTGILKSNAMNLLLDKIPPMTPAQKTASFEAAQKYFLSNGVTSVHDVDSTESYQTAEKFKKAGDLAVRVYTIKPLYKWQQLKGITNQKDKWVKQGGVKGFVDGSLGSHTAAFHDHYSDQAGDKGYFIFDTEDLYQWISEADKENLQITTHAIGDNAIHTLLNIYERVIQENGKKDRRLRMEHVQHLATADIKRFAELGVIASMQPYHAIDDGRWAEELIGPERIKTTYAFKSLLDAKAILAFGSDWAVAPASPLYGIYAAVTRRTLDDKNPGGWVPEQKISVEQALTAYTKDAAFAAFEEDVKGTLEVGKLADFVILSEDLFKSESINIRDIKVLETYVGGQKVFDLSIEN